MIKAHDVARTEVGVVIYIFYRHRWSGSLKTGCAVLLDDQITILATRDPATMAVVARLGCSSMSDKSRVLGRSLMCGQFGAVSTVATCA